MAQDGCPGLNPRRLVALMAAAVRGCALDLSGGVVLTEAASGAYVVTPVLAALAGARQVLACTRSTRHGTAGEIAGLTLALARAAGVQERIEVVREKSPGLFARADIVTNSGHVRPIHAEVAEALKPTAVIPLMYEAWEFRPADVDLAACRRRGIAVAGTNERHPAVNVFAYLGIMAVKLLLDAGVAVLDSRLLLVCDNPFRPFIEHGLNAAGAMVDVTENLDHRPAETPYDACVVAVSPGGPGGVPAAQLRGFAEQCPGSVVAQFWGDVERTPEVAVWPASPPPPGHMGILPSAVGPEPIVRLQAGGLKVGEVLWRARSAGASVEEAVRAAEESGYGQAVPERGEPCSCPN